MKPNVPLSEMPFHRYGQIPCRVTKICPVHSRSNQYSAYSEPGMDIPASMCSVHSSHGTRHLEGAPGVSDFVRLASEQWWQPFRCDGPFVPTGGSSFFLLHKMCTSDPRFRRFPHCSRAIRDSLPPHFFPPERWRLELCTLTFPCLVPGGGLGVGRAGESLFRANSKVSQRSFSLRQLKTEEPTPLWPQGMSSDSPPCFEAAGSNRCSARRA